VPEGTVPVAHEISRYVARVPEKDRGFGAIEERMEGCGRYIDARELLGVSAKREN